MSIIQISKIQVRTGNLVDVPQLSAGEFGWADDERRLFIGNDSNRVGDPDPNNTEILTTYSPIELSGNVTIANVENFHVGGGNNGYFLQTDGNGTLVWSALPGTSNITIAGSNNQIQYNVGGAFNASANLRYFDSNTTLQLGGGNGNIVSSYLSINVSSEFANALFTGNLRLSNTDQNTFAVGSLANTGNYVTIGSGQIFGNRITVNQANVNANIIANTITANLVLRAASDLIVNDGTWSNSSGELIVANYNVRANGLGLLTTGYINAAGAIYGNSFTGNTLTVNTSANINNVIVANGDITAANINSIGGVLTGNGSGLSALNASNISSGTIPSARLSGSYSINANNANTAGTVTTAAQPNITSVGTLTSLAVGDVTSSGTVTADDLIVLNGAICSGNITQTGNMSISAALSVGGNLTGTNATFSNTVTAATFVGNVTTPSIVNGNSNITIFSNGDIRVSSFSQADIISIVSNGITATTTIANSLTVVSNVNAENFVGALANGTSNVLVATNANISINVNNNNVANFTATQANIFNNLVVSGNITATNLIGLYANGNSNVSIPAVNGNVNISAIGTPNVVVVSNTGINVSGVLNSSNTISAPNITVTNTLTSNLLTGVLTTASQPNITAVGNLVNLIVSNTISVGSNVTANILIANNGIYGELQTSSQPYITEIGQLSNLTIGNITDYIELYANGDVQATGNAVIGGTLTVTGNVVVTNLDLASGFTANGNIVADYFEGNGSALTGIKGPLFLAYNSVNQTLTAGNVDLIYNTTTVNDDNYYDETTGVFTPLVEGFYQVNVVLTPELASGVANGSFYILLKKNGTIIAKSPKVAQTPTWGIVGSTAISTMVYMNGTTDELIATAVNSVTGGVWQSEISTTNYFQAFWIKST